MKENKDIIYVYDESNKKKKVEVVSLFNIENYEFNYIIYCELDRSKFYVAKYKGDKIVDLNTEFDDNEIEICNRIFERIQSNEINN